MGKRTHGPYLIAAIEYGDIEKVSHILSTKFRDKSKVKVFLTSEVRRLASDYVEVPLLLAATIEDPTIIKYFVTKHEANVNFVYEYGHPGQRRRKTALLAAVRRGLYVTVDALLQLNADINFQDHKGRTPLHHAVRKADYRMAKLLLARGAQTGAADIAGNSPLHIASIFGHTELCRLLLRHGSDLYKKGQHGALPIHIAAREGHASLVKMMISLFEVSADIRVPCYDEREQAPIHVAAAEGHYETVFTLLDACGSDVNVRDSEGETPLHCAAIREFDPLGMKSKDDYTETVKVLLNFGAEVNFRNARGETALHLAARNELQKVVEVLVLAGGDPLAEDNDRNKPIDLVAPEDAVSRQTLKTAMADRERIMNEAREVRAKGFTTSLQRELPLSVRSQSTLNMPLAGMQGAMNPMMSSRYMSHTGIYQPPAAMSTMMHNQSALMQSYGNHSGSRTSSSNDSKLRSDFAGSISVGGPRLPQSMLNVSAGHLVDDVPPAGGPAASIRKTRSVEELDQPRSRDRRHPKPRGRKSSYQASEVSSIWNVTPPGSVHDLAELEEPEVTAETPTKKSGRFRKVRKQKPALNESDEELEKTSKKKTGKKQPQPAPPHTKHKPAKPAADVYAQDGNESEEYYLDDDDSVDDLDVEVLPTRGKKKHSKPLPAPPEPSSKGDKKKKHGKGKNSKDPPGVHTWVDEQARMLKERNRSEAINPVAHSTPPTSAKHRRRKDSTSSTSSSSSSSSSSTSGSEASSAPKGPPPPPPTKTKPATKPKPPPPPKPSKDARARHAQPLVQMENPGMGEMIQLDVDETQQEAQTVISIIPVNPPGPTRVEKVPAGASSSTFVNLQNSKSGKDASAESSPRKQKQPVPARRSSDEIKPVPRPRESKKTSPAIVPPQAPSKKVAKQPDPVVEDSESSTDFSDGEDEPVPMTSSKQTMSANTPTKPTATGRPSPAKPQKKPGLVFEKAGRGSNDDSQEDTGVVVRHRKPSDNRVPPASTNQSASRSSGNRHRPSATHSDEEDSEEESDEDDSESDEVESAQPTTADVKTVVYSSDGKSSLGYTLVGGNTKGVFVNAIDPDSEAAHGGLAAGDHILRVNGQLAVGKTRDEVFQMLHGFNGQLTLIVRHKPNLCQRVAQSDGGAGDALCVRAHFSVDASKKGELNVSEGDIFDVVDTLPEGFPGYWRARKMKFGNTRRPSDTGPGPLGLIPSRSRADKIVVTQNLAHGKPGPNDRGGLFFRSFRRAKSATRNGSRGQEEDDDRRLSTGMDVVSYERVSQKIADARRPVIVLGLFCDTIRTMLVRDSPGLFVMPADEVETPKDETPVNVQPILTVPPTKHCLLILSPPAIEYLQQRTDINPLAVYVSPVSKAVVKAVKAKLAPAYQKNPGYMYDEAARFEKNYAHLFSATVPYTTDDSWFFNIKDAVERLQNQPTWTGISQVEIDAASALEAKKYLPSMPSAATSRPGRAGAPAARMSRTTDDLPQVQSSKNRAAAPPKNAAATAASQASRLLNTTAPSAFFESTGRPQAAAAPAAPAAEKSVAKSRGQSTSSLDKVLTSERNQRPNYPTPSHETPL